MTENDVFDGIRKDCGSLEICKYKETGCGDCPIRQILTRAEKALEKVQEFESIGTIDEFNALREKEAPKKPIPNNPLKRGEYIGWHCPMCNKERWSGFFYPPLRFNDRCPKCGQVIDWKFREYET